MGPALIVAFLFIYWAGCAIYQKNNYTLRMLEWVLLLIILLIFISEACTQHTLITFVNTIILGIEFVIISGTFLSIILYLVKHDKAKPLPVVSNTQS